MHAAWISAAARVVGAAAGGPCAACAAPCSAPLCQACRDASLIRSFPWTSTIGDSELSFVGAYHAQAAGGPLSPLGRALRSFKDHGDRHAGRCMARLFAATMPPHLEHADAIVAVPSDMEHVRLRGLAPASWIARSLVGALRSQVRSDVLRRRPGHPPQRGLDGADRRLNAARAFTLGRARVAGYTVVLVDDVVTTGATLATCCGLLREAGAVRVVCAVVACADNDVLAQCRSKTAHAGKRSTAAHRR